MAPFPGSEPEPDESTSPAWLVTFIDLVSLLLTFFVLLFSMSSLKGEPWQAARATLATVFGGHEALPQPRTVRNEGWRRENEGRDLDYLAGLLTASLASTPALQGLKVERAPEGVVIRLPASLLFKADAAALSDDGQARLLALARLLAPAGNAIVVNGFAESVGADSTLWETSLARALAVTRALHQAGVPEPLAARGLGQRASSATATGDAARPAEDWAIEVVISERTAGR